MNTNLPPVAKVRAFLEQLGHAQVQQLSTSSGVPFTTLWKIRDGTTTNPGIETVRKFWLELDRTQTNPAPAATETVAKPASIADVYPSRADYMADVNAGLIKDERQNKRRAGEGAI